MADLQLTGRFRVIIAPKFQKNPEKYYHKASVSRWR